jgi:hypothetical protein
LAAPQILAEESGSEDASADQFLSVLDDNLETRIEPAEPEADPKASAKPAAKPTDDKPEEPEPKAEEEEEAEAGEEKPEEEEAADADKIETLADLAREFDVEEATLTDHLQVALEDGTSVPLSSVISAYKEAPAAARIAQEVLTERETLRARSEELNQKETAGLQQLAGMVDILLGEIEGQRMTPAEFAKLEEEDPLLYLKKRDEHQRKSGAIAQAIQRLRQADTDQTAAAQKADADYRNAEARQVAAAHPEWVNPTTGNVTEAGMAAAKQIDAMLISHNYTQEEIDRDLVDRRQIEICWKASEYDRMKNKAPLALKRARKEGGEKVLKARARRGPDAHSKEKSQALRRRLAKTGSEEDAAEAILDLVDFD